MNVLSLFDGISCGRVALDRAGVSCNTYIASEIDSYASAISRYRYPDILRAGDVRRIEAKKLPEVNLLLGGFPCQGFSVAGKRLAFDDPRSQLFFECVRLKNALKPDWFLFENVTMKKELQDRISEALGCDPVLVNSSLVSAQHRKRLYWTNIPFEMPTDKGLLLKDILQHGTADRDKSFAIDANYHKGGNLKTYYEFGKRQLVFSKDGLCNIGEALEIKGRESLRRVYSPEGKAPTVTTMGGGHREPKVSYSDDGWRKLTPLECERLQTLPDGYTAWGRSELGKVEKISNTQRYKCIGNGWTVDVIAHILRDME